MRRTAALLAGYIAACLLAAVAAPPGASRLAVGVIVMGISALMIFHSRGRAGGQFASAAIPRSSEVGIEPPETVAGVTTESALHVIAEHYLDGQDSGGVRLYATATRDGLQIDLLDRSGGVKVIHLAVVE